VRSPPISIPLLRLSLFVLQPKFFLFLQRRPLLRWESLLDLLFCLPAVPRYSPELRHPNTKRRLSCELPPGSFSRCGEVNLPLFSHPGFFPLPTLSISVYVSFSLEASKRSESPPHFPPEPCHTNVALDGWTVAFSFSVTVLVHGFFFFSPP